METAQEYSLKSNNIETLIDNGSKHASNINNKVAVLLCSGLFSLYIPGMATSGSQQSLFSYSVSNNNKKYEKNIRRDKRSVIEFEKNECHLRYTRIKFIRGRLGWLWRHKGFTHMYK